VHAENTLAAAGCCGRCESDEFPILGLDEADIEGKEDACEYEHEFFQHAGLL
jgi:hypothetical protein